MYADTTDGFREAATEAEFVDFGNATEQFVWVLDAETVRLDAYQIDSKKLILR